MLVALIVAGWAYGPRAYRHWQFLRLQNSCLSAELAADRPTCEPDGDAAAAALVASYPGEYRLDRSRAVRVDARWAALLAELRPPRWRYYGSGPVATSFLHERRTPAGRRRLVVVEQFDLVTAIEPATWTGGARVLWRGRIQVDQTSGAALCEAASVWQAIQLFGGRADPDRLSRFTVAMTFNDVAGTLEYELGDEDRMSVRLLDPAGFVARAKGQRAAARGRGG